VAEPGDATNDATIWFGSMFPTGAPDARDFGVPYERGFLVAREDFARTAGGLPDVDGGATSRPVGIVACDDTDDPQGVARHLVEIGAPAVVGFATSAETIDLATSVFLPNHVLVVVANGGSPLVGKIPDSPGDPRMVVRTTAELYAMSVPLARLVPQVFEPYARRKGWLRAGTALRVALLRRDTLTHISLGEDITSSLQFNGASAIDNGPNFREFIVHSTDDPVHTADVVERLVQFAPNVILFIGSDAFVSAFFEPMESLWPSGRAFRPLYAIDTDIAGPALGAWIDRRPDVRGRFFGMYGPLQTKANLRFSARYNEGLSTAVPYTMTPSPSFDAFYMLAYAAFAAGTGLPTGPELASAMGNLVPPGIPAEVGARDIPGVLDLLREHRRVDLEGAATNLDLNRRTGDVVSDAVLHCMRRVGGSLQSLEIPVKYDASAGRWSGALSCP
jgi:hypothetical protein